MGESCSAELESVNLQSSSNESNSVSLLISKRQLKKIRKKEKWDEIKLEKRKKEREKYKLKRQAAIEKGMPARNGPSRKELKRNKSMKSSSILKIAVDLDYDNLMNEKDVAKCVKQLLRIYTINRRSHTPAKLNFTGIKENGSIHETLKKNDGYENWDVQWSFQPFTEHIKKEDVVYLTSDSDNVLQIIDEHKTYIIGGLVDHNHHKGLCYDRAKQLSLVTARLPLSENIDMKTRTVLSTYHVFEILLRVSEGKSWVEAILETIPMRKGAIAKSIPSVAKKQPEKDTEDCKHSDLDPTIGR